MPVNRRSLLSTALSLTATVPAIAQNLAQQSSTPVARPTDDKTVWLTGDDIVRTPVQVSSRLYQLAQEPNAVRDDYLEGGAIEEAKRHLRRT